MAEIIDKSFPQYLAIGMTPEQFWDQESSLLPAFREAWEIKREHENRLAWLHGKYIYEALCDVSPLLHAFAKNGTQAQPYLDKPYEFVRPKKQTKEEKSREQTENTKNYMNNLMMRFNKSNAERRKRGEEPAGRK